MKFKRSTPPMELVEFVKNNAFTKIQLGIPIGHRYIMNPRMPYGFQFNDDKVGPQYLSYAAYTMYKDCFKVLDWLDEYGHPITKKEAIEKTIMVHREILSYLYWELQTNAGVTMNKTYGYPNLHKDFGYKIGVQKAPANYEHSWLAVKETETVGCWTREEAREQMKNQ